MSCKTQNELSKKEYLSSLVLIMELLDTSVFAAYPPTPVYIEPVTEERANRCIARIDLLSKIREEIVVHPKMDQRVKQCQKSLDLPSWWISGRHDRELMIGAAK